MKGTLGATFSSFNSNHTTKVLSILHLGYMLVTLVSQIFHTMLVLNLKWYPYEVSNIEGHTGATFGSFNWNIKTMKKIRQLDVVVSPPAFLWDPNLTLTHVTFDLDPSDL